MYYKDKENPVMNLTTSLIFIHMTHLLSSCPVTCKLFQLSVSCYCSQLVPGAPNSFSPFFFHSLTKKYIFRCKGTVSLFSSGICCLCFIFTALVDASLCLMSCIPLFRWAHVGCAVAVPEVIFVDVNLRETINTNQVSSARKKLVSSLWLNIRQLLKILDLY